MKTKTRKITVNNKSYHWLVRNDVDGDGGDRLDIFVDKKKVYSNIFHGMDITPALVAEKVKESCA